MTADQLSQLIIKGMEEKKASDIVLMDLRQVNNSVTDMMILASGSSDKQVEAIAESIEEEVNKGGEKGPWRIEGKSNNQWVIMDYVNVVAHIFLNDKREFYGLEDLWGDAKITRVN